MSSGGGGTTPRRPSTHALQGCEVPTLLLLAQHSRQHDIRRLSANAHRLLPQVETEILPGATHHSVPMLNPQRLNTAVVDFLS